MLMRGQNHSEPAPPAPKTAAPAPKTAAPAISEAEKQRKEKKKEKTKKKREKRKEKMKQKQKETLEELEKIKADNARLRAATSAPPDTETAESFAVGEAEPTKVLLGGYQVSRED
ncbi:hypothetical protein NA57DRAFT_55282 [Rhizodiscina lignyota]|uniref:Uncharacterized protein n=1 Tax=Rhizodiscina lignyota TaxID=1504668 RepID=A0A9P4M6V5_9PEZI|nr:hypothetical protein NA57DRAFT_55282 [Rhizodiscina lignyota]